MVTDIRTADFDYPLPSDRIAQHPVEGREGCRLMVLAPDGTVLHRRFSELPTLLPSDALMVCNNTKVVRARMRFTKDTGAAIEIFCLEPHTPADYVSAFEAVGTCRWKTLVGNRKRWKQGRLTTQVLVGDHTLTLNATLAEASDKECVVQFDWDTTDRWADIMEAMGEIPIPPYLNRSSEAADETDYQTVYSRIQGSVAAPTAGLHFTDALIGRLQSEGVRTAEVTLHVGAGTFRPVKSDTIGDHPMHAEIFSVSVQTIRSLASAKRAGRPVVAVGTTSVRTIESLYFLGLRAMSDPKADLSLVEQWEPYGQTSGKWAETSAALDALADALEVRRLDSINASTRIIIAPGYEWHVADTLITNFHQPQSTLLLLVSSFLGDTPGSRQPLWRALYDDALGSDYRFLSYGDAMLLFKPSTVK